MPLYGGPKFNKSWSQGTHFVFQLHRWASDNLKVSVRRLKEGKLFWERYYGIRYIFWIEGKVQRFAGREARVTRCKGLSKIFRTDAVKIIKLAIRPICYHHPRSSSLPHVDTSPTVSSIFELFLEVLLCHIVKHSLRYGLYLFNGIKPASFQLQFNFWK
jgi:hypothetical protein